MRLALWTASAWLLASAAAASAKDVTIKVGHNSLEPSTVTIEKGDAVVFSNTQEMPGGHTIVADDGSFSSPALAKDKSWSHTFEKAGTYKVHIKEHPGAGGEIVVK
jgi:plastocyanin